MQKQKELYFQVVRGICICSVILIHCQAEGKTLIAEYYQIALRQIINFAVAVFVFMAGYFARSYNFGTEKYWKRLKKLLIPYIIWSIFYSLINSNGNISLSHIVYNLFTGRASAQLYYIIVLVELTFLTPFLMKILDRRKLSIVILFITPCYLLLGCGYCYIKKVELAWMGRDFCAWIIFYYCGMLIKHYGWKWKEKRILLSAYLLALIVSISEGVIVNYKFGMFSMAIGQINVTTMIYSLTVIALLMNKRIDPRNKSTHEVYFEDSTVTKRMKQAVLNLLIYIGDISFGIYFSHTFVLKCVSFVLRGIGFMEIFPLPVIQLVQFSLTLFGCVLGIRIFQWIDKKRKLLPYLGL